MSRRYFAATRVALIPTSSNHWKSTIASIWTRLSQVKASSLLMYAKDLVETSTWHSRQTSPLSPDDQGHQQPHFLASSCMFLESSSFLLQSPDLLAAKACGPEEPRLSLAAQTKILCPGPRSKQSGPSVWSCHHKNGSAPLLSVTSKCLPLGGREALPCCEHAVCSLKFSPLRSRLEFIMPSSS